MHHRDRDRQRGRGEKELVRARVKKSTISYEVGSISLSYPKLCHMILGIVKQGRNYWSWCEFFRESLKLIFYFYLFIRFFLRLPDSRKLLQATYNRPKSDVKMCWEKRHTMDPVSQGVWGFWVPEKSLLCPGACSLEHWAP